MKTNKNGKLITDIEHNPEKELLKHWNKFTKGKKPISDYVPAYLFREAFVKGYNYCYNSIQKEKIKNENS